MDIHFRQFWHFFGGQIAIAYGIQWEFWSFGAE
jgi:hypothetical protein